MSDPTNPTASEPVQTPAPAAVTTPAAPHPAPQAQPQAATPAQPPAAAPAAPAAATAKEPNYWAKNGSLAQVAKLGSQISERDTTIQQLQAQAAQLSELVNAHAQAELAALPAADQDKIRANAKGDPQAILDRIGLLKSMGRISPVAPPAASTSVAPTSTPAPAVEDPDIAIARQFQALEKNGSVLMANQMLRARRASIEAGVAKLAALKTN